MSAVAALEPAQAGKPFDRSRVAATLRRAAADLLASGSVQNSTVATIAMRSARDELERIGYIQDNREVARALRILRMGADDDFGAVLVIIGTAQTLAKAEYLAQNGPVLKSA